MHPEMRSHAASEWFPALRGGHPDVRLFCFPYAGASALPAFARWSDGFPDRVDVRPLQLPGRGRRIGEAPFTTMGKMIEAVGPELVGLLDRPFAIFGHSMGALMAFEMGRWLRRHNHPQPSHLYVSGRRAPDLPEPIYMNADEPDETFIRYLRALNGTPPEVLDDPELMEMLLPALRADLSVCRSYRYCPEPPLDCSLTALGGRDDLESSEMHIRGWKVHTAGRFESVTFAGGHFYVHPQRAALLSALSRSIAQFARV